MSRKTIFLLITFLIFGLMTGCSSPSPTAPAEEAAGEDGALTVFAAYATAIEEPWDGVIHAALNKAKEEGQISYSYSDDIGYAGDMERILREVGEEGKAKIIFGDAFGNEEAVRRVAKDYPEIAFVFGSGGGPAEPNFSVFDNWWSNVTKGRRSCSYQKS